MKKVLVSILFSAVVFIAGGTKANTLYPFSDSGVKNNNNLQNQQGEQYAGCIFDWFSSSNSGNNNSEYMY
jgi:hypothetical protein